MSKNFIFSFACLLLAVFVQAQNLKIITVEGYVTLQTDGSPVEKWDVFATALDSLSGITYFGMGLTDSDGEYSFEVEIPDFVHELQVGARINCPNQWGGFTEIEIRSVPIDVLGKAHENFEICDFMPPVFQCWSQAWSTNLSGLNVAFYGNAYSLDSLENFTYVWDFGDGTTSTEQTPTHNYSAPGNYAVTLTATSASGCTTVSYIKVFVWDSGPIDSILVSGYVLCAADSTPAVGTFVYGSSLNFPPGSSGFAVTDSIGFYQMSVPVLQNDSLISVQIFSNWGIPVEAVVIAENGVATANFLYDCTDIPPFPDCQALIYYKPLGQNTFQFSADLFPPDPAATYLWNFGDGSTSTEANPTHTYSIDGLYTVSLVATNGDSCEAHACEVVCAFDNGGGNPIDTFYYDCQAMFFANLQLTPVGTNIVEFMDISFGQVIEWAWDFGDGSTSTEQNPVHTYAADGIYKVTLAITTADGCESEITMEIWIGSNPWNEWNCQAMFIPLPDATGLGFQFFDLSTTSSPINSWQWDFGDGSTSTEQNPFHIYAQSGIYNVSLSIAADSCNSIFNLELDTDNPLFFSNSNIPTLGLSSLVSKSDEPNPIFDALKIFPNPTSGELSIAIESKNSREAELTILDLSGKILKNSNRTVAAGASILQEDVSILPNGIYFLRLKTSEGLQTSKFSKVGN